jgi:predicted ArsR family transcriptional regulator
MEGSILALLEEHGSLAAEQVAAHLHQQPGAVREALHGLRERGLVDVFEIGQLEGLTTAAAYWRLTDEGPKELIRRRSADGQLQGFRAGARLCP